MIDRFLTSGFLLAFFFLPLPLQENESFTDEKKSGAISHSPLPLQSFDKSPSPPEGVFQIFLLEIFETEIEQKQINRAQKQNNKFIKTSFFRAQTRETCK